MQARKTVIALLLLSVAFSGSAFATPRQDDANQQPRSRVVRKTEKPKNPWIGTIVTILDWLSIPPG